MNADTIRSVRVTLRCGAAVPAATLTIDTPDVAHQTMIGHWIPESGLSIFDLTGNYADWPAPFGVNLLVTAEGYQEFRQRFTLAEFSLIPPEAEPITPELRIQKADYNAPGTPNSFLLDFTLAPIAPVVRPLVVDGKWFKTIDGELWSQFGCTDFQLLQRIVSGEDVDPVLEERAAIGFNQLRVLLTCDWMFQLYPQTFGAAYWDAFDRMLERLAAHGLRSELVVFADATRVMPNVNDQTAFFDAVCARVAGRPDVFVELVNENDQPINTIDPARFARPGGILCSHGSKGVVDAAKEAVCVTPVWTYGTLHPGRPEDWPRLGGHNTMEDVADEFGTPGTDNESCRPDQGRGPIVSDWFDAAGNITLLCAGGTFHSEGGKASRLFDATERACAEAWMAGARAVPLSYQRGQYIAGHLHGFPIVWVEGDSSRAHGRLMGDRACLSLPQMREGYTPVAVEGWRIVKQTGSVVEVQAVSSTAASSLLATAIEESRKGREGRRRRRY